MFPHFFWRNIHSRRVDIAEVAPSDAAGAWNSSMFRIPGPGSLDGATQGDLGCGFYGSYPLVMTFMTNSSPWYRWPIEIDGLHP
jgi:hypothetical protein